MVKTDNSYLKKIDETVKGETVEGVHNNNFYLKEISENIGQGGGGCGDLERLSITITYMDSSTEIIDFAIFGDDD